VRLLDAYRGPAWTASEVVLVASHLGEGPRRRPRHEVVAELPLGD
jgi:2'-5' RNA ligase